MRLSRAPLTLCAPPAAVLPPEGVPPEGVPLSHGVRGLTAQEVRAEIVAMRPALCRRAQRWVRSAGEAEDLAQETVLRAFSAESYFASRDHLRAWLYTVLRNLFISGRRRGQSARRAEQRLVGEASVAAGPREVSFLSRAMERALDALPEVFRDTVRLVDLEDHSYGEAAQVLDIPVGTVMSRLFRGRKRLAHTLCPG